MSVTTFGTERACQFAGGGGACGRIGGPIRVCEDFGLVLLRGGGLTGVGIGELSLWTRGVSLCPSTSALPFSEICPKLGDVRLGSVCKLSDSKTVAFPCDGKREALSAIPRSRSICSGVRSCRISVHPSVPCSVLTLTNRCRYSITESLSPCLTVAETGDFSANSRRRLSVLGPT